MERILELQEIDLSIDRLETRRKEIESGGQISVAREQADELENRLGELRMSLDAVRREQQRLEGEVASLESKIAAEERRLYDGSVANPKELESIQHEVAGLRQRKTRIEDGDLEQMEQREELESRIPGLEGELSEARRRLGELEASSEIDLKDVVSSLTDRRGEREALLPAFEEELLELYEDLRASKKGVAAVALQDGVCGGCRQKLSALELEQVKKKEGLRRCPSCRRILVLE